MMTVHEVSKISGVSIRALHHYDRIGLLPATEVTKAGYRLYDENALERLQHILLFKVFIKKNEKEDKLPKSLFVFCQFDEENTNIKKIKTAELFLSFLIELGKCYLLSKYDRRDIDPEKFKNYISQIKEYILLHEKNNNVTIGDFHEQSKEEKDKIVEETTEESENELEETLEELLEKLDNLIGLEEVKKEVRSLINMLKVKKIRESRGFKTANVSKHLVFLGNPGTGKTTVARILSKIYKQLGVLEKGQLIEVDRAGLVAGYVGQTALKTKEKIDEAMGGILFIDEAYTLAKGGNDFGQESIDTILKAMEDERDKFVVIVAGYSEPMERFLESNPGLKSRFNKYILFQDYSEQELFCIFESFCKTYGMFLNDEAEAYIKMYLEKLCFNKPDNFANGREMRNLFETVIANQSNRLAEYDVITDEELNEITVADF